MAKRRILLNCLVAAIVAATRMAAQELGCGTHPDAGAILVGSFTCTAELGGTGGLALGDLILPEANGSTCNTQYEVCVWRTASGRYEYIIKPETIQFTGPCDMVDAIATVDLFATLAGAAVDRALSLGHGSCSASCVPGDTCRVLQASCVQRSGLGVSTTFASCDSTAFCSRTYVVCCPSGPSAPSIREIPGSGMTSCSAAAVLLGGCEVTCP